VIELYDAARLTVKRDHTLAAGGATLLVTAGLMAAYTAFLHFQLSSTQVRTKELQAQLASLDAPARAGASPAAASPRAALVADLQRQAENLERDAAQAGQNHGPEVPDKVPTASQWMAHLGALTLPETTLQKVDIERSASARLEGLATSPQALTALVQAWERQEGLSHLLPRSIDIKQEKLPAPFLRFQLRATPAPALSTAATPPAAAPPAGASELP
jgi:hypothetical protein